jgi:hypothetical protein
MTSHHGYYSFGWAAATFGAISPANPPRKQI